MVLLVDIAWARQSLLPAIYDRILLTGELVTVIQRRTVERPLYWTVKLQQQIKISFCLNRVWKLGAQIRPETAVDFAVHSLSQRDRLILFLRDKSSVMAEGADKMSLMGENLVPSHPRTLF